MAATAITANELLARVKARAQVPSADGRLTDAEILALLDDLIRTSCGREVFAADDGRWVKTASDEALIANRATYRLPDRALAAGVDEVLIVNSAGDAYQLDYVDRSDVWEFGSATGIPCAFALLGDVVHLLPTPVDAAYSLRVRYIRRPSKLALTTACVAITAVSSTTLTGTIPSTWTSPTTIDVVESTNNVEALEDDVAVTFTGSTITRSSGTWTTTGAYAVAIADYACLAGTSCVVQVPDVAIAYVADLGARDVCAALGDRDGAAASAELAEQRRREMIATMAERSRTRPKIVQRNSPLRVHTQRFSRWGWR